MIGQQLFEDSRPSSLFGLFFLCYREFLSGNSSASEESDRESEELKMKWRTQVEFVNITRSLWPF